MTTELNQAQQMAVTASGNVLVLAGPGSGKTQVLSERIKFLLLNGSDPARIVAITYTNRAAEELRNRIGLARDALGYVGTLHGYLLRIVQKHGRIINLPPDISVMDAEEQEQVIDDIIANLRLKVSKTAVKQRILQGPPKKGPLPFSAVEQVAVKFFNETLLHGELTYDAIHALGGMLLGAVKEMGTVKIPVEPLDDLLVDEFQDSSPDDWKIYQMMFAKRKFYVADMDQAIYSFRGGSLLPMLEASRSENITVVKLETNYRCRAEICEAAQVMIARNPDRIPKRTVALADGGVIQFWDAAPSPEVEAAGIASTIQKLLVERGQEYASEIAVLVRYNKLVDYFRESLQTAGIPVAKVTGDAHTADYPEAITFLRFLCNLDNDRIAVRVLSRTKGAAEAKQIAREAAGRGATINRYHMMLLKPAMSYIPAMLANHGFSGETVESVRREIEASPPETTIPELVWGLQGDGRARETLSPGVAVMTMHGAKGKEWDTVFLPAFEQHLIPGKPDKVPEERRLAYVAMTRAKTLLTLSWSRVRRDLYRGYDVECKPSQFIAEAMEGTI